MRLKKIGYLFARRSTSCTEGLARLYFFGVLAAYFVAMVTSPHPPMLQDLPTWVYEGVAVSHLLTGHPDLQFSLKHYPIPNSVSDFGLAILVTCFGWAIAAKFWISLYLLFSASIYLHFLRSTGAASTLCLFLSPTLGIVNLCFWFGFLSFQIGLGLSVFLCSILLRDKISTSTVSALLVLIFLSHAVAFAFSCLTLVTYVMTKRCYRLLYSLLPSFLLGIWYLLGRFVWSPDRETQILPGGPLRYTARTLVIAKINTFFKSLGYVNPFWHGKPLAITLFGKPGMILLTSVCFVLGITMLYTFLFSSYIAFRDRLACRFLWIAVWLSSIIGVVCPSQAFGISDPGARFMVCSIVLGALLAAPPQALTRIACVASLILGVAGICFVFIISRDHVVPAPPNEGIASSWMAFAHVDPGARSNYYEALAEGDMKLPVFNTSLLFSVDPKLCLPK